MPARAFGAPHAYLQGRAEGQGGLRTLGATAEEHGAVSIATELGGAGTVTPAALAIARHGLRGLLAHAGILDGTAPAPATRIVSVSHAESWTYAPEPGVFEPLALPGDEVAAGEGTVGTAFQRFDAYRDGFLEGTSACDAFLEDS